jgi:dual 3',5'-cyclic-AMP and -GMP phosphodiesterase 11
LNKYFPSCSISIAHAQLFDLYACEYDRNRALLEVVHDLFQQQTNLDNILFRIMQKAQALLKCRRCSILLVLDDQSENKPETRKAFDLIENENLPLQRRLR